MRTFVANAKSVDSRWHVIDADGQVLGRIATLAARLLQGAADVVDLERLERAAVARIADALR